jgi:ribosomal protein S18 acetylase RimI-like enzyme
MDNFIIRKAKHEDIPAMIDLLQQLFSIEKDYSFNRIKHATGLTLLINEGKTTRILIAELDNKIVGMLSAQMTISTTEGNFSITLEDMVVDIKYRKKGIGQCLMKTMEEWALNNGITRLQLLADKTNTPALAYYEKQGWKQTKMFCLRKYTKWHHE